MLINKADKIFIAGVKGMVGSAIKRKLIEKGYKNLECPTRDKLDLTKTELVFEWFREIKPSVVIIAAAKVGGIYANNKYPVDFLLENLKIQNNIIEAAWKNNTKRLLFLGSSCIYPKNSKQPIQEEELLKSELEKTNEWYALAKISGIKICQALRKQYGFDAISLMPTNLYGEGDNYHEKNSHVLPALLYKAHQAKINNDSEMVVWGSGKVRREFLYVDDLAEACVHLINMDYRGTMLNIGTGIDITIDQLAKKIMSTVGIEVRLVYDRNYPDGTPRKVLDVSKINELGWEASTSLQDGLRKVYNSKFLDK